jgi:quinol monooxygenase YgiN
LPEPNWIRPTDNDRSSAAPSIHATIRVHIPARKRKEAQQIIGPMIERIKLTEGCLGCRFYTDVQEEGVFMIHLIWSDEASFRKHVRSEEFRRVLLVVEMAGEPPEILFNRVAKTAGIEAISGDWGQGETFSRRP